MVSGQVQRNKGVTLVGGGEVSAEDIEEALKFAPHLIGADGGADQAIALGFSCEAAIGDLDSISEAARGVVPEVIEDDDQDTTDFQKCLGWIDAPLVLAVGFLGARLDHTLATCAALAQRSGPPTVVIGREDVMAALPRRFSIDLQPGTRVSLFPMKPMRHRSEGVRWAFDDLLLDPLGRLGTSNAATGPLTLDFEDEGALLILPRSALPDLVAAVTSG